MTQKNAFQKKRDPLHETVGVCALVPDQWHDTWQPRHHVLSRLSRYFHVVWVSPAPEWRKMFRRARTESSSAADGLHPLHLSLYEPDFWPPKFHNPEWLGRLAFDLRVRRACRFLKTQGCDAIILYLWRPGFAPALAARSFDLTCYHIDDDYSFSEVKVPANPKELELIAKVDQVFIHSPGLMERLGSINPHTAVVPNGVDYQSYAALVPEPRDLASIPRPRVGYTGRIKKELDWRLVRQLAVKHPEWSFVFVGPRAPHPEIVPILEELARRDNVHFLGAKTVNELSSYPQHFDVCIMPYALGDYSAHFIYPLKLHEYLAGGSPVVGTRIRSLEKFTDVVTLAVSLEEWSTAIAENLGVEQNSQSRREIRQAIAQKHDWDVLVKKVADSMIEGLGGRIA